MVASKELKSVDSQCVDCVVMSIEVIFISLVRWGKLRSYVVSREIKLHVLASLFHVLLSDGDKRCWVPPISCRVTCTSVNFMFKYTLHHHGLSRTREPTFFCELLALKQANRVFPAPVPWRKSTFASTRTVECGPRERPI